MGRESSSFAFGEVFPGGQSLCWKSDDIDYHAPYVFSLGDIPSAVVCPHNEALYFWKEWEHPANLLHIDKHQDLKFGIINFGSSSFEAYVRDSVDISSFITVAMHEGIVASAHFFNPYSNGSHSIAGRLCRLSPDINGKLVPHSKIKFQEKATLDMVISSINSSPLPLILDFDLDGLMSSSPPKLGYNTRLKSTLQLCKEVKAPSGITIATSQAPVSFIDEKDVFPALMDLGFGLERIYCDRL